MNGDDVLDAVVAKFVGCSVNGTRFDAATSHPETERVDVMIATGSSPADDRPVFPTRRRNCRFQIRQVLRASAEVQSNQSSAVAIMFADLRGASASNLRPPNAVG